MKAALQLSRRERQIMEVIFLLGNASAADVAERIPDPPSVTAVRAMLGILVKKRHLTSRKDGRKRMYRPVQSRSRAARSAMQNVLDVFYQGSVSDAVGAYLSDPRTRPSAEELQELRRLISRAREEGR